MAQPTSGDDYYAKLGTSTSQAGTESEKKKIKIVAKKVVAASLHTDTIEAPISLETQNSDTQSDIVDAPSVEYVSRQAKLPESGSLDLGTKFVSRPGVVFHSRLAQSNNRPLQQRPSSGGVNQPHFVSRQ